MKSNATLRTTWATLSIAAVAMLATGCGPGRQAAWEKQSNEAQKAPTKNTETEVAEADPVALGDEAWAGRAEEAKVREAIAQWEQGPKDAETLTKLARAYYLLADGHLRAKGADDEMLEVFEKGILAGEHAMMAASPKFAAMMKDEEKVENAVANIGLEGQGAVFWYATNLGKFAVGKGFSTTLFYKDRIFMVMQHVLTLDEKFYYGAPHRYFGAFYSKAPAFAGGDMTKSKEHFDRSLELGPNYLGTKVLYAEYYAAKADDRELFTRLLNEVIAADPSTDPAIAPEQQIEQAKAKRLLAEADEIF